jgi:phosphoglycerate dehydrogenase-like enzyme
MHDFYSSSDVVVNTLPSSPGTDLFVGEKAFRAMPNTALYVNIGRGSTTDQEPLITALQNGLNPPAEEEQDGDLRIGGASLDVTTPEPLPKESPLYTLENVVLTPHMSGMSRDYFVRAVGDLFSQNLHRVLEKGHGALNAVRGKGE